MIIEYWIFEVVEAVLVGPGFAAGIVGAGQMVVDDLAQGCPTSWAGEESVTGGGRAVCWGFADHKDGRAQLKPVACVLQPAVELNHQASWDGFFE